MKNTNEPKGGSGSLKKLLSVCIIAAIIIAVIIAVAKGLSTPNPLKVTLDFYYPEASSMILKSEKADITAESEEEILTEALKKLKAMPTTETLAMAVPHRVDFISVDLNESTNSVIINVSSEYSTMTASEELICRACIVWTLTGLDFVDSVALNIDGTPLTKSNGEPMGKMSRDDIVINPNIATEPINSVNVTLYFSNAQATGLEKEIRQIEVNPNQPLEKYVMEQLISGPMAEGLYSTVPTETKIKDIKTIDGICYLDLNADFVNKHNGGSTGELLTIYSIVNSLCEVKGVDKVQFLIEGQKQEEFKGHVEFSLPFSPTELNL